MVCRYFILSGIPMSRISICDEIQSMVSFVVENLNFDWDVFEFITEKRGRRGPSKEECLKYYDQKLVVLLD